MLNAKPFLAVFISRAFPLFPFVSFGFYFWQTTVSHHSGRCFSRHQWGLTGSCVLSLGRLVLTWMWAEPGLLWGCGSRAFRETHCARPATHTIRWRAPTQDVPTAALPGPEGRAQLKTSYAGSLAPPLLADVRSPGPRSEQGVLFLFQAPVSAKTRVGPHPMH